MDFLKLKIINYMNIKLYILYFNYNFYIVYNS